MRPDTAVWLAYVHDDLQSMEVLLAGGRWAAASFHAQQVAEKSLKALYGESTGKEPPRIHNLVRLARLLQVEESWLPDLDVLSGSIS